MTTKYKFCPHCAQPLEDDGSCPGCTYGHKRQQTKAADRPRLCAWNDHGMPCHLPGHLSQSTIGAGPWYCRSHFAQIMGWPQWRAALPGEPKPISIAIDEITRGLKEPYRSYALKTQGRTEPGEEK